MHVTEYAIGMAILKIFRDFRVFHSGGSLLLDDVSRAWCDTGLRTRDLETGLRWLEAHGCVRRGIDPDGGCAVVALQQAGEDHLTHFPHRLSEWMDELDASLILMRTGRRRRAGEFFRRVRRSLHGFDDAIAAA